MTHVPRHHRCCTERLSRRRFLAGSAASVAHMKLSARGARAADADTEKIAAWFFERYLLQSIA